MILRAIPPVVTLALGLLAGSALTASDRAHSLHAGQESPAVTGIGGVFFKADDPGALRAWYRDHLGIEAGPRGADFVWHPEGDTERLARTVWSVFPRETEYFGDSDQSFMVNYRVRDLDALLARLRERGIRQVGETERYEYGNFAWVLDGEGNRVELWEPAGEGSRGAADAGRPAHVDHGGAALKWGATAEGLVTSPDCR